MQDCILAALDGGMNDINPHVILLYALKELQSGRKVVLAAVNNDGRALQDE